MVQPAHDWHNAHEAGQRRARHAPLAALGHPLSQALMRTRGVEVRDLLLEDMWQMASAQEKQVIQALAPHAPQEPFTRRVLPGPAICRAQLRDADGGDAAGEGRPVLAVVVPEQVSRALPDARRLTELLGHPGVGGWRVTATCTSWREPSAITKNA